MRLGFVIQRYGTEVTGGAESLCRWVAERMQKYFDVEILTTCALDYLTWDNYFPPGKTTVNSVIVHRFPTDSPRDMLKFNVYAKRVFANSQRSLVDELTWIQLQGPLSASLLSYLKDHEDEYDLFIFVTYSYLTTFLGVQLVSQKSLLIPTAHDEPHFHLSIFQPIFHLPQGIIYCTAEEKRLVQRQWRNEQVPCCIAGAGLESTSVEDTVAPPYAADDYAADNTFDFPEPYLLYIGRVDVMKGCRELLTFFLRYLDERDADLHLVLLGKQRMEIPDHPNIHAPGFVTNRQKDDAIRGAAFVINPSEYESLSLLILESWQLGTPVLVNGNSEVLVEHCLTSNGGLYYSNYNEFALCVDLLLSNGQLRKALGTHGQQYVEHHYSWGTVEKTYVDFIMQIANNCVSK